MFYKEKLRELDRQISGAEAEGRTGDLAALSRQTLDFCEKLWNIIEHSSDSIYVTDGTGTTLYTNQTFKSSSGPAVGDITGKNVHDLEKMGIFRPSVSAIVLREGRPCTVEQTSCTGDLWIATGVPIFGEAGNIEMVVVNSKNVDEIDGIRKYLHGKDGRMAGSTQKPAGGNAIVYGSGLMEAVMRSAEKVASMEVTLLITGESGVGKNAVSRYIHDKSDRRKEKYIEVNCSAIPEALFESEVFGYESGAFTGAKEGGKKGLMELAHKGTLVLDEIGDMPLILQAKLLQAIQTKRITRVGGLASIEVDVRLIASTNRNLEKLVEEGKFRSDLYYRLNVFPINIPPLRQRREDVAAAAAHYLARFNKKYGKAVTLTPGALEALKRREWPGNVRELEHFIERLVIVSDGLVSERGLPGGGGDGEERRGFARDDVGAPVWQEEAEGRDAVEVNWLVPLQYAVEEAERKLFRLAAESGKSSYEIADMLGTSQSNAYRKLRKYAK